eukprot:4944989-Prymnesium_polylepis.1
MRSGRRRGATGVAPGGRCTARSRSEHTGSVPLSPQRSSFCLDEWRPIHSRCRSCPANSSITSLAGSAAPPP